MFTVKLYHEALKLWYMYQCDIFSIREKNSKDYTIWMLTGNKELEQKITENNYSICHIFNSHGYIIHSVEIPFKETESDKENKLENKNITYDDNINPKDVIGKKDSGKMVGFMTRIK